MAALLMLAPLHPRPEVPPVGAEVDQTFAIALPAAVDGPAVTIAACGARIVIARSLLEQVAALDGPSWSTEEERSARIAGGRAVALLRAAGPVSPAPHAPLFADTLGDAEYLVAQVLEAGKAVVVPAGTDAPAAKIAVRFFGTHPGPTVGFGRIVFSTTQLPAEFFSVSWFAS